MVTVAWTAAPNASIVTSDRRRGLMGPPISRPGGTSEWRRLSPLRWPTARFATACGTAPRILGASTKEGIPQKREAQAFAATIEVSMRRDGYVAPSAGRITV